MNWSEIKIWYFFAGLGLFLFGMSLLEDAIKNLSGRSFKNFLQKHTGNPIKAVLAGALTTGVMQSSSMVILLVMSFTGAGIIGLKNGIGMILGANIGTTITGWIVALLGFKINLEDFFLPVITLGSLIMLFFNTGKINQAGRLLLGFGLMFMGLEYMKQAFLDFAQNTDLSILQGQPMIYFVLFGFLIAAAIRSSSATVMIGLSSLASGTIDLLQAGYFVVGADIGTSVTGILGTLNGNAIRKKTGWSQFFINIITAILTLILIKPLFYLIGLADIKDPLIALVTFHSAFNFVGVLAVLPFIGTLSKRLDKLISSKEKSLTQYLYLINSKDAINSIDALKSETILFVKTALNSRNTYFNENILNDDHKLYYNLKSYENEIFEYSIKIYENQLSSLQVNAIQSFFSSIRSATLAVKDIKDIYHNIEECRSNSDDNIYNFYIEVKYNESKFYNLISDFDDKIIPEEKLTDINAANEKEYTLLKQKLIDLYKRNQNFDLATMLNLVREIRDSRNHMIKAISICVGNGIK